MALLSQKEIHQNTNFIDLSLLPVLHYVQKACYIQAMRFRFLFHTQYTLPAEAFHLPYVVSLDTEDLMGSPC